MRNEIRRKLLIEYAVALVAERDSWERLSDPELTEAQRCRLFGEWKQTAATLKQLGRRLRDAEPAPAFALQEPAPPAASSNADAPPATPSTAWLAGRLRLIMRWCAETAMPRPGSA